MPFQSISPTRTDLDSPIDEDLMGDLADNDDYLFESAVRGGEYTVPVRLALARGRTSVISVNTDGNGHGVANHTVTFSSDAFDGDPAFDTAPVVTAIGEEMSSGADLIGGSISVWVNEGGVTTTTAPLTIGIRSGTTNNTIDVRIHWIAIAPVTPGE